MLFCLFYKLKHVLKRLSVFGAYFVFLFGVSHGNHQRKARAFGLAQKSGDFLFVSYAEDARLQAHVLRGERDIRRGLFHGFIIFIVTAVEQH